MIFHTLQYWLFFIISIIIYYKLNSKYRPHFLVLISGLFLFYFSLAHFIYAFLYGIINYFLGKGLNNLVGSKRRRLYIFGLIINIGQLVILKYTTFLLENFNLISDMWNGKDIILADIIIPIGISYYTFQSIGYIINIYKKVELPEESIVNYLVFTLFYPKILAGPIERSNTFLPQLRSISDFKMNNLKEGLLLVFWGLLKKIVIADRLVDLVFPVYNDLDAYSTNAVWIVLFLQTVHLYFDFSGYTDIAIGTARVFGLKLSPNFNRPFLSQNISVFWRRWHMSLSYWCNDYIFKSVMYKRRRWGRFASSYAVLLTFLVLGIWHGPNWTYVVLGLLQVFAINFEFYFRRQRIKILSKMPRSLELNLGRIITFTFISITLVFFNSSSIQVAKSFFIKLFSKSDGLQLELFTIERILPILILVVLLVFESISEKYGDLKDKLDSKPMIIRWIWYYILIILVVLFGVFGATNFVYFQF